MMLDRMQITRFREWINSNDWTMFEYKNKERKNQWNCICSAMDWIDVAIQYIIQHPINSLGEQNSIGLFSYLSCVDIVVEAIEQLHRVVFSTGNVVFSEDRDCFKNNQFNQTDREYFKTLRACFGAHPVNLTDPEDPTNKNARRFASWSGGFVGPGDFSVYLYSNKIDGKDIALGIHFSQVETFLEKYYNHLSTLKNELQRQLNVFVKEKKKKRITKSNDPIEQLHILQIECAERLNNTYYRTAIEELLRTFQTPIIEKGNQILVNRYLDMLKVEIEELKQNLQKMVFRDLASDHFIESRTVPLKNGWAYWVEKLNDARLGHGYPETMWINQIEDIFAGKFVFRFSSYQELYVLVKAAIYDISEFKL